MKNAQNNTGYIAKVVYFSDFLFAPCCFINKEVSLHRLYLHTSSSVCPHFIIRMSTLYHPYPHTLSLIRCGNTVDMAASSPEQLFISLRCGFKHSLECFFNLRNNSEFSLGKVFGQIIADVSHRVLLNGFILYGRVKVI